ncbi:MAG: chromate transporter [Prevotellaceae bacterium]|jgi:chromate transporter|nr:chromate transporter [Prevotellaceae bacterium]
MLSILIQLFITFFKIGLFGFGGGYAMLSMIQYEVVEAHQWLTVKEFTDIVAISQSTPGPIAINSATYIGYTAAGGSVLGSIVATFAVCLPSVIIMLIVCKFFLAFRKNKYLSAALKGMMPAAVGLIAAAALMLMNSHNFVDYKSIIICIAAFVSAYFFKTGIIKIIVFAGVLGYFLF